MGSPSPQADINPYAAPLGEAQADWSLVAGVGCWRHGSLLVVHEDAQLPPICVKTGRPAAGYRPTRVRWSHPLRWPWEYVGFQVPLSEWSLFSFGRGRPLVLVAAVAVTASLIALATLDLPIPVDARILLLLIGGAISLTLFASYAALAQPLWFVRRRRKYYWLSGANRRFLEKLPPWTF